VLILPDPSRAPPGRSAVRHTFTRGLRSADPRLRSCGPAGTPRKCWKAFFTNAGAQRYTKRNFEIFTAPDFISRARRPRPSTLNNA